jgi:hypothetical protein
LTDAEKQKVKASEFSEGQAVETILQMVEKGYKVSFAWDTYNNCHCCWFISPHENEDNQDLILSGRGSTPLKALKQAAWMHFARFKEIWPIPTSKRELELDD